MEVIKELLKRDDIQLNSPNADNIPVILATKKSLLEVVQALLEKENIDINAQDEDLNSAFIWAAKSRYMDIVKEFLSREDLSRADIEKALTLPQIQSNAEMVEMLEFVLKFGSIFVKPAASRLWESK